MKVLTILGSPRKKAASTFIAEDFNRKAEAAGAEVSTYHLNTMSYKGCQGCHACKKGAESCILKDDLTEVLDGLHEADVVVIASPIYFGDVTAQLKGFIDRLYGTIGPEIVTEGIPVSRLPKGKKCLMIFTQGAPDNTHAEIPPRYDMYFEISGFNERRVIRDCDRHGFGDMPASESAIAQARQTASDFLG